MEWEYVRGKTSDWPFKIPARERTAVTEKRNLISCVAKCSTKQLTHCRSQEEQPSTVHRLRSSWAKVQMVRLFWADKMRTTDRREVTRCRRSSQSHTSNGKMLFFKY